MQGRHTHGSARHVAQHEIQKTIIGVCTPGRASKSKAASRIESFDKDIVATHHRAAHLQRMLSGNDRKVVCDMPDLAAIGVPWRRGAQTGKTKSRRTLGSGEVRRAPFQRIAAQRQLTIQPHLFDHIPW